MTNQLRPDLPVPPARIAALPVDKRGYPIPRFVALIDGEADHRVIESKYLPLAVRFGLCWVCGQPLGRFRTFLVGPMCTVNRVSSEPPMHRECAHFAAKACPFLTKPHMRRREAGLPEQLVDPAGGFIKRNPGASCAWTCSSFDTEVHPKGDDSNGLLFFMHDPTSMEWFTEGRPATREEVDAAMESGLPLLEQMADAGGPRARAALTKQVDVLRRLLDQMMPAVTA